jgi:FHA domain
MGVDTSPKGKKSIFDSLKKRLPGGLRDAKDTPKSVGKEQQAIVPQQKPQLLKQKKREEEEVDEAGTETVAPGQVDESNKKFAVQPTGKSNPAASKGKGQVIPEAEAPRLVYLTSYGSKVTYPLIWEETTIGRKDDNQIVLTDATISKCHCSVFRKPDGYFFLI